MASLTDRIVKAYNAFSEKQQPVTAEVEVLDTRPRKEALITGYGGTYNAWAVSFNGEKNLGEIGPAKQYLPEYDILRVRSWQAYMDSEIAKTVIDRFVLSVLVSGLKLKANPNATVLKSEKIDFSDAQEFNELVEARFSVWCNSRMSSHNKMLTLNKIAKEAFKNAKIAGDVLVILRYVNDCVKVQLVDGAHVCSPQYGTDFFPQVLANGNRIINGIELNPEGEQVAFHVRKKDLSFERVEARSASSGLTMAYMVYGATYRLDNYRGIPIITTILETLAKLDRYKEAAVGSAEERQKIAYFIEHQLGSTGESPLVSQIAKAYDANANSGDLPVDELGNNMANTVAATTNKQTFNMPINSTLKQLESRNELFFKEFYSTNSDIICAAVGIPPNVAFSIYNNSFSASRAAIKDWEQTIVANRNDFGEQFYQPIYNLFLYTEILKNKVNAMGYLKAFVTGNEMVKEAYQTARFTGPMVPHIDPLKEVNAIRAALGSLADNIPLMTIEQATENLNGGESDENIEQFAEELQHARDNELDLTVQAPNIQPVNTEDAPVAVP